jgi:hypothetical protein
MSTAAKYWGNTNHVPESAASGNTRSMTNDCVVVPCSAAVHAPRFEELLLALFEAPIHPDVPEEAVQARRHERAHPEGLDPVARRKGPGCSGQKPLISARAFVGPSRHHHVCSTHRPTRRIKIIMSHKAEPLAPRSFLRHGKPRSRCVRTSRTPLFRPVPICNCDNTSISSLCRTMRRGCGRSTKEEDRAGDPLSNVATGTWLHGKCGSFTELMWAVWVVPGRLELRRSSVRTRPGPARPSSKHWGIRRPPTPRSHWYTSGRDTPSVNSALSRMELLPQGPSVWAVEGRHELARTDGPCHEDPRRPRGFASSPESKALVLRSNFSFRYVRARVGTVRRCGWHAGRRREPTAHVNPDVTDRHDKRRRCDGILPLALSPVVALALALALALSASVTPSAVGSSGTSPCKGGPVPVLDPWPPWFMAVGWIWMGCC